MLYWVNSTETELSESEGGKVENVATNENRIGNYTITHINAVGNILLVFTATAIYYFYWKNEKYNLLGNKLPEIAISFGLVGHPILYSGTADDGATSNRGKFTITFDGIAKADIYKEFSQDNKTKVTEQVMAKVNRLIAEQTIEKGRFCFPFFVRWAYRLYDGSHVMQSAPVLMTPSTTPAPIVMWKRATGDGQYTSAELDIMMVAADLDYCLTNYGDAVDLSKWKDIIIGIDIFISKPIYTYDQNGEIKNFSDDNNFDSKFVGRLADVRYTRNDDDDLADTYLEYSYAHIFDKWLSGYFHRGTDDSGYPNTTLHMPEFSEEKAAESIENTANFYLLATVSMDELERGTRKTIVVKDDYLQSLVNRETLTDDYLSHDRLMAASSYGFNSRLNLSGVKRELFGGFISNALFQYCQYTYAYSNGQITKNTMSQGQLTMRVYVRENGEDYYVDNSPNSIYVANLRNFVDTNNWTETYNISDGTKRVVEYDYSAGTRKVTKYDSSGSATSTETLTGRYKPTSWGSWIFYPNSNAYKVAIYQNGSLMFVCDLKPHDFLNGAYAFLGLESERRNPTLSPYTLPVVTPPGEYVPDYNKVYTSEVNNPFYFPIAGINTVGTGEILGISSATKALSQGQFGQFPLYAFTTEGVWALTVNSEGLYSATQPVTRDVCINAESITQLDSAVLFATARGLMLISGSETSCISDAIFDEMPFDVTELPGMTQLHSLIGHNAADACLPVQPFLNFLSGCRLVYDYVHQRIIVFNPSTDNNGAASYSYAYVYSMRSQKWGMIHSSLTAAVNSYPDALAMASGEDDDKAHLVSFSSVGEVTCKGLFVTRPFKLDGLNIHKAISEIYQRGHFQRGDVTTVLYGSRDMYTWFLVWSSQDHRLRGFRGTSYKYFRIAGTTSLTEDKSVFGASVNFDTRFTNRLR